MNANGFPNRSQQKAVVVLGMHRSGTSMAGALLNALGVDMGENLLPQSRANPIGYYEDLDFLSLNQRLLHAARGDAYHPPSREALLQCREAVLPRVQHLVSTRTADVWGWKDPRTSLTLEVYIEAIPDPHLVICRRSHEAIARSLDSRGDLTFEQGLELLEIYESRIDRFITKHPEYPRLELPYEKVIRHPEPWIDRISAFLSLTPTHAQRQEALAQVLPKGKIRLLRARRLMEAALERPQDIPGYVKRRFFSKGHRS